MNIREIIEEARASASPDVFDAIIILIEEYEFIAAEAVLNLVRIANKHGEV